MSVLNGSKFMSCLSLLVVFSQGGGGREGHVWLVYLEFARLSSLGSLVSYSCLELLCLERTLLSFLASLKKLQNLILRACDIV